MAIRVLVPGEEQGDQRVGGVHKRPPIPDGSLKAECPKFMSHGPCGGFARVGLRSLSRHDLSMGHPVQQTQGIGPAGMDETGVTIAGKG